MSLSKAFKNPTGPYEPPLKVMVLDSLSPVTSDSSDGTTKSSKTAAVSDGTVVAKLICYDKSQFNKIVQGNSLTIHNILVGKTDETIVATSVTKIIIGEKLNVPDDHYERGKHILNPPVAAISSVLELPSKVKCTIEGKIVQDEAVHTVPVKGDQVQIREIHVEDHSGKVKVALWREASESPVKKGDYIIARNVMTKSYRDRLSLYTTYDSTIEKDEQKGDVQDITKSVAIVRVDTCINETDYEFFLEDESVVKINKERVKSDNSELVSLFVRGPVKASITYRGSDAVAISLREPFTYMYHATQSKTEIIKSGDLYPDSWFCLTPSYDGGVPDYSPYGPDKVLIKPADILALFKDPRLNYFRSYDTKTQAEKIIKYNELFLSEGPKKGWAELDIQNNEYIIKDDDGTFYVKKNDQWEYDGDKRVYYWTTIRVEKAVPIAGQSWKP